MKSCCGGTALPALTVAGASVATHPMLSDQPSCPAPAADVLPPVSQVLFPQEKKTANFRWVKSSAGQDILEVELSGKIRWISVLTSKP